MHRGDLGWRASLSIAGGYREVSSSELERFAEQSYPRAAEAGERLHFSLAGSQAKIALYRGEDGTWYEPQGLAPSTHILKPASSRFEDVAENEAVCTMAAALCDIDVPHVSVLDMGRPVICTTRFDRTFDPNARRVNGLSIPARLHQEDFCQATGTLGEHKYEEGNRSYLDLVAGVLRDHSTEPVADLLKIWDIVVFNYLVGNCDAHLKNLALLRDETWNDLRLAPAYDLVCTSCCEGLTTSLAMSIGRARHAEDVTLQSFEELASCLTIPAARAMSRVVHLANVVPDAVRSAASELERSGVSCAHLVERILEEVERNAARLRA